MAAMYATGMSPVEGVSSACSGACVGAGASVPDTFPALATVSLTATGSLRTLREEDSVGAAVATL